MGCVLPQAALPGLSALVPTLSHHRNPIPLVTQYFPEGQRHPPWAEPFSPAGVLMPLIAPSGIFLPVVERRRRFNINDRIKELGMLIPKANDL